MCAGAILQARIKTVVFAAKEPKFGACGSILNIFNNLEYKFNHEVEVIEGIKEEESKQLIKEFFKNLRKEKISTPILMLTAKDEIDDKVFGLDLGADDYMTKPFSTSELLARIRALSRRKGEVIDEELEYKDIVLKMKRNELVSGENKVKLSLKEFKIMEFFMNNPEQIITKERLIDKIWGDDSDAEYNNVEVYISFLRKKLQFINAKTQIKTSRGSGYLLEQ
jgi:DNA-binding response OmpR family regulator